MANFAIARFMQMGDWQDLILRGPDETAFTGPILTDCKFPEVLVAKAMSHGDDLDMVLVNGEEAGMQSITVEQLQPNADYLEEHSGLRFIASAEGKATLNIDLQGRTPVHIVRT